MAVTPGSTGLDVNSIVSQLMTLERRPLTALARQEAQTQAQLSAWGSLKGALSSLQGVVNGLDKLDKFRALKTSIADTSVASVSASAAAVPGSYSLEVITLAQQHKLKSEAFDAVSDTVGTGSLTFQFGTYDSIGNSFELNTAKASKTISIASGQGTLAGMRDAVNAADFGVTATIVNDGSGNRLVFTSEDSGTESSIRITVSDDDGNNTNGAGLSRLAYDPEAAAGSGKNLTQTALPQDAWFKIDGISITKSSNVVTDAVEGLTLTLLESNSGTPTTVTVSRDYDAVKKTIEGFVNAYNQAARTLKDLTAYNATTKQAGLLQGDGVGLSIQSRLRTTLTAAITALSGTVTSLPQIGVTFQKDGLLALNSTTLQSAMDSAFNDIGNIFAANGKPTDSRVAYADGTEDTEPGTYAVAVSQVATHGTLEGSNAAGLTITGGVNDTLSLTVDGTTVNVTLAAGVYATAEALAAELQTKANGALESSGLEVSVTESLGVLTVTSASYGGDSSVSFTAGAAAANLFGGSPQSTAGEDIAGSINGVTAVGTGRTLTGTDGNASAGLQLTIDTTVAGSYGSVTFSRGYANQLNTLLEDLLGSEGAFAARNESLNARLKSIDQRETALNNRLADIERRYRAQFVALDALLARMNTTSSYLTNQLANLPGARDD